MAASSTAEARTKLTVQVVVDAPVDVVWKLFSDPEHIVQWNAASDDWHTTKAANDLTVGGRFSSFMAAKDGSDGFEFWGTYTAVEPHAKIEYTMGDGRVASVEFTALDAADGCKQTRMVETFDAETVYSLEHQRIGWQGILDNFKKHVEAHVRETP